MDDLVNLGMLDGALVSTWRINEEIKDGLDLLLSVPHIQWSFDETHELLEVNTIISFTLDFLESLDAW